MRIIDCEQGSEQWELQRMLRPTASNFGRIITPARGQLSKSYRDYAAELVAQQLQLFTEPPPSFWMEWGTETEPIAIDDYSRRNGVEVERVGFVLPDHHDNFGGSPDGLVNQREGGVEVKCPKPETLIKWHGSGVLLIEHKAQVQGLMLITGCQWWDFVGYHPELAPFQIRVEPDLKFHWAMMEALEEFNREFEQLKAAVSATGTQVIQWGE